MNPGWSRALSKLLAVGVFTTWFAFSTGSLILLTRTWPHAIGVILSLLLSILAFGSRPRLGERPEGERLERIDAPQLFRLLDEISEGLGSPTIDLVVLDGQINASTTRFGLRRTLVITIGLPLWEALSPSERVAVLAHEVSHNVNGDIRRDLLVGNALSALDTWTHILRPSVAVRNITGTAVRILQLILVSPVLVTFRVLRRLTLASHRLAEFESDRLATTVAGTEATISLLDRLILKSSVELSITRAVRSGDDIWVTIRDRVRDLPSADSAAIRREAMKDKTATDSSHPPAHLRIEALREASGAPATVQLDAARSSAIDRELDPARAVVDSCLRNPGN